MKKYFVKITKKSYNSDDGNELISQIFAKKSCE